MAPRKLSHKGQVSFVFSIFITEFILIFIVNAVTLVAFARNRHLRKRTTYLMINLSVADLLVGAVSGPLGIYFIYLKWNMPGMVLVGENLVF